MIQRTKQFAKTLSSTALALSILTAPAYANQPSFQTPSGNILCYLDNTASELDIFCLIFDADWPYPVEDEDCDADRIRAVSVGRDWPALAHTICTSDVFWPYPSPTLSYGADWSVEGFTCSVARTGVTCRDDEGTGGFEIARGGYSLN